ncbi:hypothetical protein KP509_16G066900 [Ceratopteris richardii]|nr:hypothetical protein KP509_16G066900 [Ceratopteris richardii]
MDFVSVWSFDLEKDNWSNVEAKGELPVARIGHSVTRAGSVLILFGGEDSKGRKLNDLHMFDLKSSMWLPLLAMGSVPSPRSKHVAAIYDERLLLVFGGQTKNKSLNDLYALDFEAMEWSRLKARGVVPGPRAGAAGVLFNDNWYIAGGDSNGKRYLETIALDITRMTWSVVARSNINSPSASQGFSLVLAQRKGKTFLVAFGGRRPGIASEVEVLFISEEHIDSRKPDEITVKKPVLGTRLADQVAIHPDVIMPNERLKESGRSPSSEDQVNQSRIESPRDKPSEEAEGDSLINAVPAVISEKDAEEVTVDTGQSDESESKQYSLEVKASYEKKLAAALKRNEALEAQLKAANTSRDDAERSLVTVIKSRQKTEKRLAIALKEIEVLKEKLRVADLGQEESMNLTNIVHTENMRLDHDLAFLKAVLEDTQKELQTTRGVLSSERSRAFQLQVELFELKQTMQSLQSDTSNS